MSEILKKSFFNRDTLKVAPELLGREIIVKRKNEEKTGIITEVEAYTKDDPACHAARGMTPRNVVMFGPPGYSYVYFIYGMYHCLNFVTEKKGIPGAVLIRALEVEQNKDIRIASGPGKLCKYLNITKEHNNLNICNEDNSLTVTKRILKKDFTIVQDKRIGISQAKEYLWRWYIKDNPSVSRLK